MPRLGVVNPRHRRARFETYGRPAGKFAQLLAARNPWVWMKGGDASSPFVDSALPSSPGWTGGSWAGFPMPPPGHFGPVEGANRWPMPVSGTHINYAVSGATTDGRKACQYAGISTMPDTYIGTSWAYNDNAPVLAGAYTSFVMWYRCDGTVTNSRAGNHASGLFAWTTQFQNIIVYNDSGQNGHISIANRDWNGSVLHVASWTGINACNGAWHLLGLNMSGTSTTITADLWVDGVRDTSGPLTLTATSGQYLSYDVQTTGLYISGDDDTLICCGGLFTWQDFAVFTGGTNACNLLTGADYAALYVAR